MQGFGGDALVGIGLQRSLVIGGTIRLLPHARLRRRVGLQACERLGEVQVSGLDFFPDKAFGADQNVSGLFEAEILRPGELAFQRCDQNMRIGWPFGEFQGHVLHARENEVRRQDSGFRVSFQAPALVFHRVCKLGEPVDIGARFGGGPHRMGTAEQVRHVDIGAAHMVHHIGVGNAEPGLAVP